jgi:hypothetical protein
MSNINQNLPPNWELCGLVKITTNLEGSLSKARWKLLNLSDNRYIPQESWFESDLTVIIPYGKYKIIGEEVNNWNLIENQINIEVSNETLIEKELKYFISDPGYIVVNITPKEIKDFTRWGLKKLDTNELFEWFESGTKLKIPCGSYLVIGENIDGWLIKNEIKIEIHKNNEENNPVDVNLEYIISIPTYGQLYVTTLPEELNAKWKLLNDRNEYVPSDTWLNSKSLLSIPIGDYTIIVEELFGYIVPNNNLNIKIIKDVVLNTEFNYTESIQPESLSGIINVDITPKELEAKWKLLDINENEIPSDTWFNNDETVKLNYGDYKLTIQEIDGWEISGSDIYLTVDSTELKELNIELSRIKTLYGCIGVNISPNELINYVGWKIINEKNEVLPESGWFGTNEILNIAIGNYTIIFKEIDGWNIAENNFFITINKNTKTTIYTSYSIIPDSNVRGLVKVGLTPSKIVPFAKWKLQNIETNFTSVWFDSDSTVSVPYGHYKIIGREIPGWRINENNIDIFIIINSEITILNLEYIQHGNLKVRIHEDNAKTDGRWRIVGTEIWYFDGDEIDLDSNSYEIEFEEISNNTKPNNIIVNIVSNETTVLDAYYIPYGILQINITLNNSYINELPGWRIKNSSDETWNVSGQYLSLPVGDHIIEFNTINNKYTHSDITTSISSNTTNNLNIEFEGLQVLIIPTRSGLYSFNYNNLKGQDLLDISLKNIEQVVFNHSGRLLVMVSREQPFVSILDTTTFEPLNDFNLNIPLIGCRSVCFSHDDIYLVISHNNFPYITIYDTRDWSTLELDAPPTSYCNTILFNSSDRIFVVGYTKSPYLSFYNVTNAFSLIDVEDLPPDEILSLKYNNSDLLVGHQTGLKIYDNSFNQKTITYLDDESLNNSVYGIEVITSGGELCNNKVLLVTSRYIHVYQFSNNTYEQSTTLIPIEANINTYIKTDNSNKYVLIGSLRNPNIIIYDTTDWSIIKSIDDLDFCKKFDISPLLSNLSYICTPLNISPLDGKRGLKISDKFESSDFEFYNDIEFIDTHDMSHWRIINSNDQIDNELIYSSTEIPSGSTLTKLLVPNEYFNDVNTYRWQVRYKGISSGWSLWSRLTSFTTAYTYIDKPINQSPNDSAEEVIENITLVSTAFISINITDTHDKSDWKVYSVTRSGSGEPSYQEVYYSGTVTDLTEFTIPSSILLPSDLNSDPQVLKEYAWSVRYKGLLIGWSEWSDLTHFTTGNWYVSKPHNIFPNNEHINIDGENLTFISSEFSLNDCTDEHKETIWEILDENDSFHWTSGSKLITNPGGNIQLTIAPNIVENIQKTYKWHVKYKGEKYGWSEWSDLTSFITKSPYESLVIVNITPSEILPGQSQPLRWCWRSSTSEIFGSYILPGVETLIPPNQNIVISFEPYTGYVSPPDITQYMFPGNRYQYSVAYITVSGSLKINLTPSEGMWRIAGTDNWRPSGYVENNLIYDTYTIVYKTLSGYDSPSTENIVINSQVLNTLNRLYTDTTEDYYTLKVVCNPNTGKWKLQSESIYHSSGDVISLAGIDSDIIVFQSINGYSTPDLISLTIPDDYLTNSDPNVDQQLLYNVTYQESLIPPTPPIPPNSLNYLSIHTNVGFWRINYQPLENVDLYSGYKATLPNGTYTISFTDIVGYITPEDMIITLIGGEDKFLVINYKIDYTQSVTLSINISPTYISPCWSVSYTLPNGNTNDTGFLCYHKSLDFPKDTICKITGENITGWITPEPQQIVVTKNTTITLLYVKE